MGTAYSSYTDACRLSSRSAHSSNSGAANESLPNHGFSELETDHLIGLCRLVCHERLRQVQQEKDSETCFLSLIWRCSHLLALQPKSHAGLDLSEENLDNMEARLTQIPSSQIALIQKRRQQLETICTPSLLNTAMNDSLENIFCNAGSNATQETATTANQSTSSEVVDKKEADEQFLEFASNMLWRHGRGHNQKNTLDFAWNVCQHICINSSGNGQSNSTDGTVLAKDIIELCFQSAIMIHYMLQDDAFDNAASGDGKANRTMALLEPRNTTAENNTIQALANSLLEYAQHYRADHKFGGYGGGGGFDTSTSSAEATNPAEGTVTKREFSEWQRKVVPDLMCYSIVKFFQVLFFPPGLSQLQQNQQPTDGSPQFLFQQYTPTFPIIHSSKELASRNANTEIIPVLSPVFGSNVRKQTSDNSDDENISATTLLSPPVFAFVSISASKFGEKVRIHYLCTCHSLVFFCAKKDKSSIFSNPISIKYISISLTVV